MSAPALPTLKIVDRTRCTSILFSKECDRRESSYEMWAGALNEFDTAAVNHSQKLPQKSFRAYFCAKILTGSQNFSLD